MTPRGELQQCPYIASRNGVQSSVFVVTNESDDNKVGPLDSVRGCWSVGSSGRGSGRGSGRSGGDSWR